MANMDASKLIERCKKLKGAWSARNSKFRNWYEILKLRDDLAQEGMESVTSNDPRTGYNLGRHLLVTSVIAHKVVQDDLTPEQVQAVSQLETYVDKRWAEHETRYRQMGRQGFIWRLASDFLAYGWYAVFSMVDEERIWSEIWSPAETYPAFDDMGMPEVVHIYTVQPATAARKAKLFGVKEPKQLRGAAAMYDYWGYDDNGDISNFVILDKDFLKPPEVDSNMNKIGKLPVFCSPLGGLPDIGVIDSKWQEHFGESLVAVNEALVLNYNKMLTYTQQLMRDTAAPRWLELSNSEDGILKQSDLFKRGAIFKGQPGETVTPLPTPPIPVELRQITFDYQNMMQRGLFPWAMHGNVQQQMSYLAMANVAASSMQVLTPYVDGLQGLLTDINNFWMDMITQNNVKPYGLKLPQNLPEKFQFETQVDVEIPGYLVQRATVARMLDPTFRLPTSLVMDRLFPEVKNPLKAMAQARKDDALSHPKAVMADATIAYREQARMLRESGNPEDADAANIYEKLANAMEAEIVGQQPAAQPRQQPAQPGIAREVQPTRELEQLNQPGGELVQPGGA